jgi:hypothetical protein
MNRVVGGRRHGKTRRKISEILSSPFRAGDDNSEERDSSNPQRLACGSKLADVPTAEGTVETTEHREEDRPATQILGKRHVPLNIGCG